MSDKLYGRIDPAVAASAAAARLQRKPATVAPGEDSFAGVLQQQLSSGDIKFSAHAQQRLAEGDIRLEAPELERLGRAVDRASAKGARESLVLLEDLALIVSIKNRTVITAVEGARAKENVFTNVDSVVIG